MITIEVRDQELTDLIERLRRKLVNLQPVMDEIGAAVNLSVKRNFEEQGRPSKWIPSARVRRAGGQTLNDTGRLRNSFTHRASANQVVIGTNVRYAAMLHFGGKTAARVIRAKNGKALNIPGIGFRRSVNHPGSSIPARPFLMIQEQDKTIIGKILNRYLVESR